MRLKVRYAVNYGPGTSIRFDDENRPNIKVIVREVFREEDTMPLLEIITSRFSYFDTEDGKPWYHFNHLCLSLSEPKKMFGQYLKSWNTYFTEEEISDFMEVLNNKWNDILKLNRKIFYKKDLDALNIPSTPPDYASILRN